VISPSAEIRPKTSRHAVRTLTGIENVRVRGNSYHTMRESVFQGTISVTLKAAAAHITNVTTSSVITRVSRTLQHKYLFSVRTQLATGTHLDLLSSPGIARNVRHEMRLAVVGHSNSAQPALPDTGMSTPHQNGNSSPNTFVSRQQQCQREFTGRLPDLHRRPALYP